MKKIIILLTICTVGLMVAAIIFFDLFTPPQLRDLPLLHRAVARGQYAIVKTLLLLGWDVNTHEKYSGTTPLHWAALAEQPVITALLLSEGADVHALDHHQCTPLHYATSRKQLSATHMLLEHGATVNRKNDFGESPLHCAVDAYELEGCLFSLFSRVAFQPYALDPDQVDAANMRELVELLVRYGAEIETSEEDGETLLHAAARGGDVRAVQFFLSQGVDVNEETSDRWTPLHYAALYGRLNVVELLLVHGANAHAENDTGETPVEIAMRSCHPDKEGIVNLLRERTRK